MSVRYGYVEVMVSVVSAAPERSVDPPGTRGSRVALLDTVLELVMLSEQSVAPPGRSGSKVALLERVSKLVEVRPIGPPGRRGPSSVLL